MIWFKKFDHLKFVSISGLGTDGSDMNAPPSPQEMQSRIFDQCSRARAILEKASELCTSERCACIKISRSIAWLCRYNYLLVPYRLSSYILLLAVAT